MGLHAVSQLHPQRHNRNGKCKTSSSGKKDDMLVTSLLPHLADVVELPLLIKGRREPLRAVWGFLLELFAVTRGVRIC